MVICSIGIVVRKVNCRTIKEKKLSTRPTHNMELNQNDINIKYHGFRKFVKPNNYIYIHYKSYIIHNLSGINGQINTKSYIVIDMYTV